MYAGALGCVIQLRTSCTFHSACISESVLAIPSLGIQLETHRGLPNIPLFINRRFIPVFYLQDVIINEGLRRWDVRYYLAALQSTAEGGFTLKVAYEVRVRCYTYFTRLDWRVSRTSSHTSLFSSRSTTAFTMSCSSLTQRTAKTIHRS